MRFSSVGLLVIFCLPLFIALDDSTVWDSNEAFYTQTPREMVQSGDWLVPHFNGEPRLNKPPLSYWIVAALYKAFGVSLLAERLAMALLAAGSVWTLFFLGKMLFTEGIGVLAAGILVTSFRFLILSRRLMIDILLLFCVLAAVALFVSWLQTGKRGRFFWSAVFLGLGILSKGPVALIPLIFLVVFGLLPHHRVRFLRSPWLPGILLTALIGGSWFLALLLLEGPDPVRNFFFAENFGRYLGADFGPRRSVFYYVGVFFADFFPWSFFFVAAALWWWRVRSAPDRPPIRPGSMLLPGAWILTYVLIFSFSHNKQEYYILPVYPAAALWIAVYLTYHRIERRLLWPVAILVLCLFAVLLFTGPQLFPGLTLWWIPLLALPSFCFLLWFRRPPRALVFSLSIFYLCSFGLYLKPFEQYKPVYPLAQTLKRHAMGTTAYQAGYYNFGAPSLRFYLDRNIVQLYKLSDALRLLSSPMPAFLLMEEEDYTEVRQRLGDGVRVVRAEPKLYTTARTLIEGFRSGQLNNLRNRWTRRVLLVTNQ